MRGAINSIGTTKKCLEVEDKGVILEADKIDRLDEFLQNHNNELLHPFIRISIEKENSFFNSRGKLLLLLINETHSVKGACKHMALSYSKACDILNQLEKELGYNVVERRHGGSRGGNQAGYPHCRLHSNPVQ